VSVTLDAALLDFVERVADVLHQTKSATIRSMIAELASSCDNKTGEAA
jgi:hypothetical protein